MKALSRTLRLGAVLATLSSGRAQPPPQVDTGQIINESVGFLRDREPEMTEEEYALYERMATIFSANPALAVKLLETMVAAQKTPSPAFDFMLGNAYYVAGDLGNARLHYESAVSRYPTFLRAWSDLGLLYYSTQKFPDAIRCFSQCVTLGDHDPKTLGLLGYCLERSGNLVPAEVSYLQALAGDPNNADWIEGLLRIYVHGQQYGRAEGLVKDLIQREPDRPQFWMTYADILIGEGRRLEAIAVLEMANDAGYAGPEGRRMLGDLYAERRMIPEAIAAYRQMEKDGAAGERHLVAFARLLTAEPALDEAARVLDAAEADAKPTDEAAYLQARGEWYAAKGDWEGAKRTWGQLLNREPMNAPALLGLAQAENQLGDAAHAQITWEEALRVPAASYDARLALASLALKQQGYQEAISHLEKALLLHDTPEVRDYLRRLRAVAPAQTSEP